jgi:dTDP-4-amino-4,6-dideoxygalactose transaminase
MSDIHASLGLSQLLQIDSFIQRRQEITAQYDKAFEEMPAVQKQLDKAPWDSARHLYCLRFDLPALGVGRRFLYDAFQAENIGVNVHYLPVYRLPYYSARGYACDYCPVADDLYESILTIPLHCCLSDDDVTAVIHAAVKIVDWCLHHAC